MHQTLPHQTSLIYLIKEGFVNITIDSSDDETSVELMNLSNDDITLSIGKEDDMTIKNNTTNEELNLIDLVDIGLCEVKE